MEVLTSTCDVDYLRRGKTSILAVSPQEVHGGVYIVRLRTISLCPTENNAELNSLSKLTQMKSEDDRACHIKYIIKLFCTEKPFNKCYCKILLPTS